MEKTNAAPKKSKFKTFLKFLCYIIVALFLIASIADKIWTMSGNNEWELKIDKNGVQVYSQKTPGDPWLKFKMVTQGEYTLSQLAALHIVDDNLDTCRKWFPECFAFQRIKPFDSETLYDTDMWTLDAAPFAPREILIHTMLSQDKTTKVVKQEVVAVPNELPMTEGALRITRMHNVWSYTPLGNGMTRIQLIQDADMGGFFPYFLVNWLTPDGSYTFMHDEITSYLKDEKYKVKFDFIEEPTN